MMNIAILSYHTCPLATLGGKDTGGMNVYVRDLTRYLGKYGIHADVFTRSQDEHVPHVLHDLGYGNRVVHIPAGPEIPLPKPELASHIPSFSREILQFAEHKKLSYDLIHSHYWMSGIAAIELKHAWGVPMLHMFHTLSKLKTQATTNPEEQEGEYRKRGEQRVMDGADRIITATQDENDKILKYYRVSEDKLITIPPGVDTSHFYPIPPDEAKAVIGVPPEENLILYVGRIEPLKGIDKLIHAIAGLSKADVLSQCPHYLIIIGGEPQVPPEEMSKEMNRLQALCRQLQIDNLVLFLGKRDQDTLPYYYSAAEMVVVPSHYESFGLVALEAMACGTPVIATQVGGLSYLVKDGVTGFTIPGEDAMALEERLTQLICKDDLRLKMGENSLEHARSYAWENIVPQIIEQYQQLTKL